MDLLIGLGHMTELHLNFFISLLASHILVDFLFQSEAQAKEKYRIAVLIRHAVLHAFLSYVLLGVWSMFIIPGLVFVSHALIDMGKIKWGRDTLRSLLLDQGLHLIVIIVVSWLAVSVISVDSLFWSNILGIAYIKGLVLVTGFVVTVHAGSVFIKKAVAPFYKQLEAEREKKQDSSL